MTLAGLVEVGLKATLRVSRPIAIYQGWSAFSFPSGHATVNTALYAFLAFLIARELPPRGRPVIVGAAALLAGAIAFSRIYLGAHWLADVLAGITLSLTWVGILAIAYERKQGGARVHPLGLGLVVARHAGTSPAAPTPCCTTIVTSPAMRVRERPGRSPRTRGGAATGARLRYAAAIPRVRGRSRSRSSGRATCRHSSGG